MHAHDNFRHDGVGQDIKNPTLDSMQQKGRHDAIVVADPLDGQGDKFWWAGNHQTLALLGQFCGNVEGNLALAGDALGLVFRIEGAREFLDETLGARVFGQEGQVVHGRSGRNVDDGSLLELQHAGKHHSRHPDGAVDVHGHQILHLAVGQFVEEHGIAVANTNIVDQDTDLQCFDSLGYPLLGSLVEFGVIANQIGNIYTVILGFDFLLNVLQLGLGSADQKDAHSLLGKGEGICFSDTISGSGNHRPFSILLEVFRRSQERLVEVRDCLQTKVEGSKEYNPAGNLFESKRHCFVVGGRNDERKNSSRESSSFQF
mmetsp:Transcript_11757/g.33778  ORF Transcript_11757/g.33778 Transcript_11757/m.33778 type:complete len:316 (-) Transcript_11757:55-1002(-)